MKILLPIAAVMVAVTGSGCAGVPSGRSAEDVVMERARAYYEAIVAGDYKGAYQFFAPSYRAEFSVQAHYLAKPPMVKITAAQQMKVACPGADVCSVVTSVEYIDASDPRSSGTKSKVTNVVKSKWIREDGNWWKHVE